ncbi:acyltransferase domain-containing protein [Sphaerochaeta sp.]|uniref:acyltransferase domain-containing protein n=1 Tax=Sphaerochaeta sp. TaxID=1972642 RepID=UPI002FC83C8F
MEKDFLEAIGLTEQQKETIRKAGRSFARTQIHTELVNELRLAIAGENVHRITAVLSQGMGMFGPRYPLVLIDACAPAITTVYEKKQIEPNIMWDTLGDIAVWTEQYANTHSGEVGLTQLHWISRHLVAGLLKLGRLQFEPKPFSYPYRLYRYGRKKVLVAQQGLICNTQGFLAPSGWKTRLEERDTHLIAHEVDPESGSIDRTPSRWAMQDLALLADTNTDALHIHISAGEKLSESVVESSLLQARKVFPAHRIFACNSWLLDPSLSLVAAKRSNLVLFMQRFSKFPVPFTTAQIFERVFAFNLKAEDVPAFPAKTSLQRNVQAALQQGSVFRTMGGYLYQE